MEIVWQFFKELRLDLPYDPAHISEISKSHDMNRCLYVHNNNSIIAIVKVEAA